MDAYFNDTSMAPDLEGLDFSHPASYLEQASDYEQIRAKEFQQVMKRFQKVKLKAKKLLQLIAHASIKVDQVMASGSVQEKQEALAVQEEIRYSLQSMVQTLRIVRGVMSEIEQRETYGQYNGSPERPGLWQPSISQPSPNQPLDQIEPLHQIEPPYHLELTGSSSELAGHHWFSSPSGVGALPNQPSPMGRW